MPVAPPRTALSSMPGASRAAGAGGLPPGAGIGLKPQHFKEVLAVRPELAFFEVHAENYMVDGGWPEQRR